jgi:hypothetical protein
VWLSPNGDGSVIAGYPWKVFRFLFSDGSTLDVIAIRDDSDLREAARLYAKAERIEGVATVKEIDPPSIVVQPKSRRVPRT